MAYTYDDQNIFAKILRGEIPNKTVKETDYSLAFHDVAPQAPDHILLIPKGAYVTADDFAENASDAEIVDFWRCFSKITKDANIAPDTGNGYRMISNAGENGMQEVPHFHLHIVAGRPLGPLLAR